MKKLTVLHIAIALAVVSLAGSAAMASAQGRDEIPLTDDRLAVDDGRGGWEVDGTPVTNRELRHINAIESQRQRAQALAVVEAILADIEASPALNPEVRRVEQALMQIHLLLEP